MQARMNAILVTGAAGFIGFHVASRLLERGEQVIGLDSLNAYYDPALKRARLAHFDGHPGFTFVQADVSRRDALADVFSTFKSRRVIHLAAQAGVPYTVTKPETVIESNAVG